MEIRDRARAALEALGPHLEWYNNMWNSDCRVEFITSSALDDSTVMAGPSQYLEDFGADWSDASGGYEMRVWESAHWLEALRAIVKCESAEEALARPFPLTHRRLLLEWAAEQMEVYEAIRRGGPNSDPEKILHDMFMDKQREVVRDATGCCLLVHDYLAGDTTRVTLESGGDFLVWAPDGASILVVGWMNEVMWVDYATGEIATATLPIDGTWFHTPRPQETIGWHDGNPWVYGFLHGDQVVGYSVAEGSLEVFDAGVPVDVIHAWSAFTGRVAFAIETCEREGEPGWSGGRTCELWRISVQVVNLRESGGGEAFVVFHPDLLGLSDLSWSPDGTMLIYHVGGTATSHGGLYVHRTSE